MSHAARARTKLGFSFTDYKPSTVIGVTIDESSGLSEAAIGCLCDGILARQLKSEGGNFTGAVVTFE